MLKELLADFISALNHIVIVDAKAPPGTVKPCHSLASHSAVSIWKAMCQFTCLLGFGVNILDGLMD